MAYTSFFTELIQYGRDPSPRQGSSSRHPAYKLDFARRVETIYAQD